MLKAMPRWLVCLRPAEAKASPTRTVRMLAPVILVDAVAGLRLVAHWWVSSSRSFHPPGGGEACSLVARWVSFAEAITLASRFDVA